MLSQSINILLKNGYRSLTLKRSDVYPHHYEIWASHVAIPQDCHFVFYLLEDGSIDDIPF
jgi:hypothetical protein